MMNTLRALVALFFMMPYVLLGDQTIINVSLVNSVFDTAEKGRQKMFRLFEIVNPVINDRNLVEGGPEIKRFSYFNVAGRGEDSFNDYLAEYLADSENRETVISQLEDAIETGDDIADALDEIRQLREAGARLKDVLIAYGSRITVVGAVAEFILEEVAQASENNFGDTAKRTQFYKNMLSTQECVILFAEDLGLGMALKIKQDLENRSTVSENQVQIIDIDFSGDQSEVALRTAFVDAIEKAKEACGFRITESIYPAEVFNMIPGGTTTFDVETYWAGLPQFPITLYTSLESNCFSASCAAGIPQTYNNGELPVVWQGGCYGNVSFSSAFFGDGLPTPNLPITLTSYAFLIDADGVVTNNSSLIQLECTYTP